MESNTRAKTIYDIAVGRGGEPLPLAPASIDSYGEDIFSETQIRQYMASPVAKKLLATIEGEEPFDPSIANDVAQAMKQWALDRGATHYTHWFQPMTGGTAEKHDAFLECLGRDKAIFTFSGKNLILCETDASSFPSGGLRCTFEARGYTAWDPTSPAFIKRHANGATLCIPTIFCSYTGQVLDKKTPVLRSIQALTHAVKRLMALFNQPEERVTVTLGVEQEYFLIDRRFYLQRPDLVQTSRTLFGAPPPKHQQLEDHYFGSIRPRIVCFMEDVEKELWRLGIPAKTRHNEAAPAQFEIAPIFEEQNLAIDHNMLTMEVLRQVAARHGLVCLLHEKPFAGVNGSGKHNNWSICYGSRNLLDPGETPSENAIFLTMLCAIIRAIDLHGDLLRSTTAGAGNDHRLGGNEAPPAIISIFLGTQLMDIIDSIENGNVAKNSRSSKLRIGVDALPILPRDTTDRNRTSPFAFTGNKFEFRMPGSSQSCAEVNVALNTIVTESIDRMSEQIERFNPEKDFNLQLQALLRRVISKHKRIIFNGDNYSDAWQNEAASRNLFNLKDTLEAISPMMDKRNQDLYERYGVLSPAEVVSRHEVFFEEYSRKIRIEGEIGLEIVRTMICPAVIDAFNRACEAMKNGLKTGLALPMDYLRQQAEKLDSNLQEILAISQDLETALKEQNSREIIRHLKRLRTVVDDSERFVDDGAWPLPKYREMLFVY